MLGKLKAVLAEREDALRRAIEERVREQGGALVGWALGASIARRVLTQVNAELDKMQDDGSELRAAFDEWMRREIARIEEDPERAAEIGRAVRRVMTHETIQAWVWDVWSRLAHRAGSGCGAAERAHGRLPGGGAGQPRRHAGDRPRRAGAAAAGGGGRGRRPAAGGADCASRASSPRWSPAGTTPTITEKLELRVGKDLQYVRVNGTLVGFLVGGALSCAVLRGVARHSDLGAQSSVSERH